MHSIFFFPVKISFCCLPFLPCHVLSCVGFYDASLYQIGILFIVICAKATNKNSNNNNDNYPHKTSMAFSFLVLDGRYIRLWMRLNF